MRRYITLLSLIAFCPFFAVSQTNVDSESLSGVVEIEPKSGIESGRVDLQNNHITNPDVMALKGEEALTREDYANAASLFALACGHGNPNHCERAFEVLATPSGLELPAHLHITVAVQACHVGIASGCQKRNALLERADTECAAENANACGDAGMIRLFGKGTAQERILGAENYARACALGHLDACHSYGQILASGSVLPYDPDATFDAFEQSCAETHVHNCTLAGLYFSSDQFDSYDPERARSFFVSGCEYGDGFACEELAGLE